MGGSGHSRHYAEPHYVGLSVMVGGRAVERPVVFVAGAFAERCVSDVAHRPMRGVRGPLLPYRGLSFRPSDLLAYDLTLVPTRLHQAEQSHGVHVSLSGVQIGLFRVVIEEFGVGHTRGNLIDATTGAFIYYDATEP
jgi:hypothetical protein